MRDLRAHVGIQQALQCLRIREHHFAVLEFGDQFDRHDDLAKVAIQSGHGDFAFQRIANRVLAVGGDLEDVPMPRDRFSLERGGTE